MQLAPHPRCLAFYPTCFPPRLTRIAPHSTCFTPHLLLAAHAKGIPDQLPNPHLLAPGAHCSLWLFCAGFPHPMLLARFHVSYPTIFGHFISRVSQPLAPPRPTARVDGSQVDHLVTVNDLFCQLQPQELGEGHVQYPAQQLATGVAVKKLTRSWVYPACPEW